jgi:lycopene cyclase domain-containing protein
MPMNSLYVLVNIAVIAGPLCLSFDRKVAFFRSWRKLGVSLLVVSTAYLIWDVIVTSIGHWSFNPEFAGVFRLAGLPVGEILFFISVPYACIFIYEVVRAYFGRRVSERVTVVRWVGPVLAAVFVALAVLFRGQGYTALVMASVAAMVVITAIFDPSMWLSTDTFFYFLLSFLLFLVANGVLTALPIVEYNPSAIWGIRVYTIPLEDFFYNLGMLGWYLFIYRLAGRRSQASAFGLPEDAL